MMYVNILVFVISTLALYPFCTILELLYPYIHTEQDQNQLYMFIQ
jgi:hypothetical protein